MSTESTIESVLWRASSKELPDSDTTVLVYIPDDSEPTWIGFHDGAEWLSVEGSAFRHKVVAWAPMPVGSRSATAAGASLIAAERARQVSQEGWTPEHDDEHAEGEMAKAAAVYALPDDDRDYQRHLDPSENGGRDAAWEQPALWPWEPESFKPTPDDRVRELVKAGALIAAEIDRLRRTGGAR